MVVESDSKDLVVILVISDSAVVSTDWVVVAKDSVYVVVPSV